MTPRQKIEIRKAEVVRRLNAITALEGDDYSDEVRNEEDGLKTELRTLDGRLETAIVLEGQEEAEARGMFGPGDGEAGEVRQLLDRTTLHDYLAPAGAGSGIEGRAAELNAALEVPVVGKSGGVAVPWAMLETRAFTTTAANDGGEAQRPVLQRLFRPWRHGRARRADGHRSGRPH